MGNSTFFSASVLDHNGTCTVSSILLCVLEKEKSAATKPWQIFQEKGNYLCLLKIEGKKKQYLKSVNAVILFSPSYFLPISMCSALFT